MATAGMPLFYTNQQSHATSSYLSPASTIASDPSFSWNMAPRAEQNPNAPRQRRSLSPRTTANTASTAVNSNNNGSSDFQFIVGGTPGELKSKNNMTKVRKRAMRAFLETNEKGARRPTNSIERSRVVSEDSTGSRSSIGSLDASITHIAEEAINATRKSSTNHGRQRPAAETPQDTSSTEAQKSTPQRPHEQVLGAGPLVVPMRTHIVLDYDAEDTPLFSSLGMGVDPFKCMFQSSYPRVSVEKLKFLCARFFGTRAMGEHWIPTVLSTPHTFLSTLCVASAHYDAILDRQVESIETTSLRTEVIHLVSQNVAHPHVHKKVDDFNMTALIQLIASEVVGRKEVALDVHEKGLVTMIELRGGLNHLGVSGYLASTISWILLESAIFRERQPRSIYSDYCAANSKKAYPINVAVPESPIYRPRRQFETLRKSESCKEATLELLNEIQMMIEYFLNQTKSTRRNWEALLDYHKKITDYPAISELRGTEALTPRDHKYEAIRLTAVLQATAILRRMPLSEALPDAAVTVSRKPSSLYSFSAPSHWNETPTSPLSPLNPRHDSITSLAMNPPYTNTSTFFPSTVSNYVVSRPSVSSMATSHPSMSSTVSHPSVSSMATSHPSTSSTTSHPSVSSVATSHPSMSEISESWPFVPLEESRPSKPSGYSSSNNPFFQPTASGVQDATTAFLTDLKQAIFDSNMSDCWQDMGGVLLWIGLTVGAASRKHEDVVLKKWFSALAMRASVVLCFEHPQAVHATMLKMGEVVEALSAPEASVE